MQLKLDGKHARFVLPTVVAPRYQPASDTQPFAAARSGFSIGAAVGSGRAGDGLERILGIARKLLGFLRRADQRAERPIGAGDTGEPAIQQRIGNAGLLLHAIRQRDEGWYWSSRRRD